MPQTFTPISIHGRGAAENPRGRFEPLEYEADLDQDPGQPTRPCTLYLRDTTRSILSHNNSPDIGFDYSVNPYRGCEHGCIYCYARPTHEWLGFSAGLDFETKILVKEHAPQLLREELARPNWQPTTVTMSGVTDCYQPIERKLKITRGCLMVLLECRNPAAIITKNHLVTRDIDLLGQMAQLNLVRVMISVTSLQKDLQRVMEPRTSTPADRLDAIRELSAAGIPTGVMMAPVIPGLTDHEMFEILSQARQAGATTAAFTALRLPYGLKDLFENWLQRHFPDRCDKVLNRIRAMRGGKLNNSQFGARMKGEGVFADQLRDMFKIALRRVGFTQDHHPLDTDHFRRPPKHGQLALF